MCIFFMWLAGIDIIPIRYILFILQWINSPATVEASFFKLLKLSAPNWFKIPGNISAISAKIKSNIYDWNINFQKHFGQFEKVILVADNESFILVLYIH